MVHQQDPLLLKKRPRSFKSFRQFKKKSIHLNTKMSIPGQSEFTIVYQETDIFVTYTEGKLVAPGGDEPQSRGSPLCPLTIVKVLTEPLSGDRTGQCLHKPASCVPNFNSTGIGTTFHGYLVHSPLALAG